jgi:hypothetical protein
MGAWIFFKLGQRIVDAERAQYRTVWKFKDYVHERPRPELISYEHQLRRSGGSNAPGNNGEEYGELGRAVAARSSDPARDRDPDLSRLLAPRGGQFARNLDELGIEAPRRVA